MALSRKHFEATASIISDQRRVGVVLDEWDEGWELARIAALLDALADQLTWLAEHDQFDTADWGVIGSLGKIAQDLAACEVTS